MHDITCNYLLIAYLTESVHATGAIMNYTMSTRSRRNMKVFASVCYVLVTAIIIMLITYPSPLVFTSDDENAVENFKSKQYHVDKRASKNSTEASTARLWVFCNNKNPLLVSVSCM